VFWRSARWSHRQTLFDGLSRLGLERFCPSKRTNLACLYDALCAAFPGRDHQVERLDDTNAYEVVQIHRGTEKNEYRHRGKFTIGKEDRVITLTPYDWNTLDSVTTQFNRFLGYVRGQDVTECLVSLINHWGGTCLKPNGGMYWLPDSWLPQWEALAQVVSSAAMSVSGRLYQFRVARDAHTLRAVIDALTEEIEAEVCSIDQDVTSAELGHRALETRRRLANALASKVEKYESLFSLPLPKLRENLSRVELAAAQAALLAASKPVEV
jgi:hypothetical protein